MQPAPPTQNAPSIFNIWYLPWIVLGMIYCVLLPHSRDFWFFYRAGQAAAAYDFNTVYNASVLSQLFSAHFNTTDDFTALGYPPTWLMPLALLSFFDYETAYRLSTLGGAAVFCSAVVPMLAALPRKRRYWMGALLFTNITLIYGVVIEQNSLYTVGWLLHGFRLLQARPYLAGALFSCMFYKPHFALPVFAVLLLRREHKAMLGWIIGVGAQIIATSLVFGPEVWRVFWHHTPINAELNLNFFGLNSGLFTLLNARNFGFLIGVPRAWLNTLQVLVTLSVMATAAVAVRRLGDNRLVLALTAASIPLISPYILYHDELLYTAAVIALAPLSHKRSFTVVMVITLLLSLYGGSVIPLKNLDLALVSYALPMFPLKCVAFFAVLRRCRCVD